MPKGSGKGKPRPSRQIGPSGGPADFTVYDFANAEPSKAKSGRMSKAATNAWSVQAKQHVGQTTEAKAHEETLMWYERNLSDFDLSDTEQPDEGEEDKENHSDGAVAGAEKTSTRRRRKKILATETHPGKAYPLDLWFLVGDHVDPEDVSCFARICHSSHIVTHSAKFWYAMYFRCHKPQVVLPVTLGPQSIERVHGLRARVIRALFLMYKPFQQRLCNKVSFESDPDYLKGACCSLMWYQQVKSHWHFYFKFILPTNEKNHCPFSNLPPRRASRKRSTLLDAADIHHNPESGNCILQIVTQNFIPLPPSVMGQILVKTTLGVGHGMRYHKMKLMFSPQQYTSIKAGDMSGTTLVLDPVLNAYVLHWWDPKYPHQPV